MEEFIHLLAKAPVAAIDRRRANAMLFERLNALKDMRNKILNDVLSAHWEIPRAECSVAG
jgi:hypothetical protein